jgi:protein-S-isoprenylcysteine O-methyltransferase Ste14
MQRPIAIAAVGLQIVLLVVLVASPGRALWTNSPIVGNVFLVIEVIGLAVVVLALLNLGDAVTPLPTPVRDGSLRTSGFYRFARHPVYSGLMTFGLASALHSARMWSLVVAGLLVIFST